MKRIGTILKKAREEQGLSLEEASRRTKIHIEKLMALENNDFKNLPAKVFIKGLIRSYARELNVDEKLVHDLCEQEFEEEVAQVPTPAPAQNNSIDEEEMDKRPVGRFQAPNSFFVLVGLIIASILIIFIYITISKIKSYSKEETTPQHMELLQDKPDPIPEEGDKAEEDTTEGVSIDSKEDLDETSEKKETKIKKPVAIKKEETKKKLSPQEMADLIEPPVKKIEPQKIPPLKVKESIVKQQEEAINKVAAQADTTPDSTAKNKSDISPTKKEAPPTTTVYSDNKLVIEAIEAVRIEIIWSDGKPQIILMKEKERKTFVFSNPLKVNINNGGAVNIYFNNKFLGVPGSLNTPIELKYP